MRFKKMLCLLGTATLLTSLISGCSAKKTTDTTKTAETTMAQENVTLKWVNWGSAEEATKPAFESMVKGFESKYPKIKIEQVGYPYNQIKDQLLVMSSGGQSPDIAQVKSEWVAGLKNADAIEPLDTHLTKETISDYYTGLLEGAKYDGKIMYAPWAPSPVLLYYNKTLMEKAGISNPPKTWPELIEQAGKIAKLGKDASGNKIYGYGVSSKKMAGAGYFFLINMWQNGGEFTDSSDKVVINSEGNVKAFTELSNLIKDKVSPAGLEIKELRNLFANGQMGFHLDMEAGVGVFEKGSPKGKDFAKEYGIMQIPGQKDENGISEALEHDLVMFKTSKNKKEVALFMEYLSGPEGMKIYNDNKGSKLPARKSVESLPFYSQAETAYLKPFTAALKSAKSLPAKNSAFLNACEEISVAIQRVALNNEEPKIVVPDLDKKIKELYKQ